jgi:hypothetical protein
MAHTPVDEFRTGDELLDLALVPQRVATGVFGAFGLMSIVLASVADTRDRDSARDRRQTSGSREADSGQVHGCSGCGYCRWRRN